ncbi:hypothetical protein BOX15_Mlig002110g2 [Macrostomum lignano]|uniref:LIM zinc-binding domain-containing protein n=1 Tax=Macrostomum lignano TaxID=282301 RepID=A0A267GQU0_9PLAT|nr:hypothetical protein BOX15_Mlig002110g2 [Macrostomum lignano]
MARRQAESSKQQQQQQRRSVNSFDDDDDDAGWLESLSNWKEKRRRSLHNSLPRLNLVEELRRADEEAETEAATTEAKEKNRPLAQRMQQRAKSVNGVESESEDEIFEPQLEAKSASTLRFETDNRQEDSRLDKEQDSIKDCGSSRLASKANAQDDLKSYNGKSSPLNDKQSQPKRSDEASSRLQAGGARLQFSKKPPAPQPPTQQQQQQQQQQQRKQHQPPPPPPPPPLKPKPQAATTPVTSAPAVDTAATLSARERLFLSNGDGQQQHRSRLQQRQQQPLVRSRSTDALDATPSDDVVADQADDSRVSYYGGARRTSPEPRQQRHVRQIKSEFEPLATSNFSSATRVVQQMQPVASQQSVPDPMPGNQSATPRAVKFTGANEEHVPLRAVNNPLMFSAEQTDLMRKSLSAKDSAEPDAFRSISNGVDLPGARDLQQPYLPPQKQQQQQQQQQQLQQSFLQPSNVGLMKILQNRALLEQHQEQRHNRHLRRQQLKQRSRSAERRGNDAFNDYDDDVGNNNKDRNKEPREVATRRAAALDGSQTLSHQKQQYLPQQQTTRHSAEWDPKFGGPAHLRAVQQQQQQQHPVSHQVVVKDSRMRVAAAPTATMTVGRQPRQLQNHPPIQQQQQQQQQQHIPAARGTAAARGPLPPPPLPPRGAPDPVVGSRTNGGWNNGVGSRGQQQQVSSRQLCSHCRQELGSGAAMAIETLQLFYHVKCFRCSVCNTPLGNGSSGADVRVRRDQLHCPSCFSSDEGISCINLGPV